MFPAAFWSQLVRDKEVDHVGMAVSGRGNDRGKVSVLLKDNKKTSIHIHHQIDYIILLLVGLVL